MYTPLNSSPPAKISCPSWDRPSPFVACRLGKTRQPDRVEKAPAKWGGQFWPQPALAGFRCCPARPATSRLPHFFYEFSRAEGPQRQTTKTDRVSPSHDAAWLRLRRFAGQPTLGCRRLSAGDWPRARILAGAEQPTE